LKFWIGVLQERVTDLNCDAAPGKVREDLNMVFGALQSARAVVRRLEAGNYDD
jgi:hypothetical protein